MMTTKGVDKKSIERKKIMTDEAFKRLKIAKTSVAWNIDDDFSRKYRDAIKNKLKKGKLRC